MTILAACGQMAAGPAADGKAPVSVEAESAGTTPDFAVQDDPDASSLKSLEAQSGATAAAAGSDVASTSVAITSDGSYSLWVRMLAPSVGQDSTYLGFDGDYYKVWTSATGAYEWLKVAEQHLSVGQHRITIGTTDAGLKIDMFAVSQGDPSRDTLDALVRRTAGAGGGGGDDVAAYPSDPYYADTRAFPGAEGYGANATGGRGGRIMFITNRKDGGAGSARAAFEASGARYVIPLVWGYVDLQSGLRVRSGDLTYAGQFMPDGQGLVLRNVRKTDWASGDYQAPIHMMDVKNVILRYLKVYRGINSPYPEGNGDAITVYKTSNVIVDHSAFAFGNDENINLQNRESRNITVQHTWSLSPLAKSTHEKTLSEGILHGAAMLVEGARRVTLSHNFFYRASFRTPVEKGELEQDIVNNYDYNNWTPLTISMRDLASSEQDIAIKANVVGNLRENGPISDLGYGVKVLQIASDRARARVHMEGNINPGRSSDEDASLNGQWKGVYTGDVGSPIRLTDRVDTPAVRTTSALQAKEEILALGGPQYVVRRGQLVDVSDSFLKDVVKNARNGTGPKDIVDGWGSGKNWSWPSLPSGGISEQQFWDDWFNPWRDANYPGKQWDDYVDGYQVIELFLNSWVPTLAYLN